VIPFLIINNHDMPNTIQHLQTTWRAVFAAPLRFRGCGSGIALTYTGGTSKLYRRVYLAVQYPNPRMEVIRID
jgi:hypothetical protein